MPIIFLSPILTSFKDRPQFTQSSMEYGKCIGESTSITCTAVGRPTPDVLLYFNGSLLQMKLMNLTYQLQLGSANTFGRYVCVSNNTVGMANITTTFNMKCKFIHEKSIRE